VNAKCKVTVQSEYTVHRSECVDLLQSDQTRTSSPSQIVDRVVFFQVANQIRPQIR
jgi:hypothetical protein